MIRFLSQLRENLARMQEELTPEAGFDRRAYGYDEAEPEDAVFEEAAADDDSPWRRSERPAAPAEPAAPEAGGAEEAPRRRPPTPLRREGVDPAPARDGARRQVSEHALGPRPAGSPARAGGPQSSSREPVRAHGPRRVQRLRARLRQPGSLRDLFLLREVIDRPIAFRGRPRRQSPP